MSARRPPATRLCRLLLEDSDLAEAIEPGLRAAALEECIAPAVRLRRGRWSGDQADVIRDGIGLLVLEGLLLRRVGVDGRYGAELLGAGDVLRPWQGEDAATLPRTTGWHVLQTSRVALLDRQVAGRLARYPDLTGWLVGRAVSRSRNLAINMAIVHHTRVDVRLRMLLWHLAGRWGRVGPDGLVLPLALSHAVLADLVAARRPTVSRALSDLADRGLVGRGDGGWLLAGGPPGELLELRDTPSPAADVRAQPL